MATIGILDVGIRATTTDFEKGMKRAMKQLSSFGAAVGVAAASATWSSIAGTGAGAARNTQGGA